MVMILFLTKKGSANTLYMCVYHTNYVFVLWWFDYSMVIVFVPYKDRVVDPFQIAILWLIHSGFPVRVSQILYFNRNDPI